MSGTLTVFFDFRRDPAAPAAVTDLQFEVDGREVSALILANCDPTVVCALAPQVSKAAYEGFRVRAQRTKSPPLPKKIDCSAEPFLLHDASQAWFDQAYTIGFQNFSGRDTEQDAAARQFSCDQRKDASSAAGEYEHFCQLADDHFMAPFVTAEISDSPLSAMRNVYAKGWLRAARYQNPNATKKATEPVPPIDVPESLNVAYAAAHWAGFDACLRSKDKTEAQGLGGDVVETKTDNRELEFEDNLSNCWCSSFNGPGPIPEREP